GAKRPVQDRPASHRQQRLGGVQGVRPQARTQTGGQNHRVHEDLRSQTSEVSKTSEAYLRLCVLPLTTIVRRFAGFPCLAEICQGPSLPRTMILTVFQEVARHASLTRTHAARTGRAFCPGRGGFQVKRKGWIPCVG